MEGSQFNITGVIGWKFNREGGKENRLWNIEGILIISLAEIKYYLNVTFVPFGLVSDA